MSLIKTLFKHPEKLWAPWSGERERGREGEREGERENEREGGKREGSSPSVHPRAKLLGPFPGLLPLLALFDLALGGHGAVRHNVHDVLLQGEMLLKHTAHASAGEGSGALVWRT